MNRTIDFSVYYYEGRAFLEHNRPLYGPASGMGFPQHFRYPPLSLFAFLPFALLPLKTATAVWTAIKCVVLFFLVRALARRTEYPREKLWWLLPVMMSGAFLVQEFRWGNAQFLIFALVAATLLIIRQHPRLAAGCLALAISLKVWPLFFVPYLAARRQIRVAASALALAAALTLLPAAYFGWKGNASLLHQWARQEWGGATLAVPMWFPSQSLGGTLQRYLTAMDYSKWSDGNYLDVHFVALDPRIVQGLWIVLDAAAYSSLLLLARRRPESDGLIEDALAFCGLALLQPYSHRIELVVLLWPAIVAGAIIAHRSAPAGWRRSVLYAAIAIPALEGLIPGGRSQRVLQVFGVDFFATCLLATGLVATWRNEPVWTGKAAREESVGSLPASLPSLEGMS